jgi:hypothetical protein
MLHRSADSRQSVVSSVAVALSRRWLKRSICFIFVALCLLQPAAVVWGDYLLTLRSGLRIRVSTYRTEGLIIHVWTDSGSMSFPSAMVVQITEILSKPSRLPPSPPQENLDQSRQEGADVVRPDQRRESPLYAPREQKSP